jgi:hypothetical protein
MKIELFRVCVEKPNHRFAASEAFKEIDACPYCKCKMNLVEMIVKGPRVTAVEKRRTKVDAIGFERSEKIDTLPRMKWFIEAIDYNEVDQDRAHDIWTIEDALELQSLFNKYGIADAKMWCGLAADMGRSLYAIERQLRMIMYCANELEKYYPKVKGGAERLLATRMVS